MNRYIKIGLFCLGAGIAFSACNTMDTKPLEAYTEDMVWGSETTADAFVLNVYQDILGNFGGADGGGSMYASTMRTEGWTPNGCNYVGFSDNAFSQENIDRYYDVGFNRFSTLRKCNLIIANSKASALSDDLKAKYANEGQFLRGLVYLFQAKTMGRFVPVNTVLAPEDSLAFKTKMTSDVAESYKLALADLEAGTNLPETSSAGRLNKYVAYAILSEAYLQAYAYTKETSYIDKAINAANTVINSGKYTLSSDFGNMFQAAGKYDKEIIFGVYKLAQNTQSQNIPEIINGTPNVSNGNLKMKPYDATDEIQVDFPLFKYANGVTFICWEFHCPTGDLADAFEVIDKNDPSVSKPWWETSQFKEAADEEPVENVRKVGYYTYNGTENPATITYTRTPESSMARCTSPNTQDLKATETSEGQPIVRGWKLKYDTYKNDGKKNISELMYENRDKRFYGTMVYDSCQWFNELITMHANGNLWAGAKGDPNSAGHQTFSNYHKRKGCYYTSATPFYDQYTDYHAVITRLGRVYMNLCEAQLLKGLYTDAVKTLNITRQGHGGLPASKAATEEEAWTAYKNERRVELAYENDYYWSLLRWGKIGGFANHGRAAGAEIYELNQPVHKIEIDKARKRCYIEQILFANQWKRKFSTKRYLFPIPQGQLDKRAASGIVESNNTGW